LIEDLERKVKRLLEENKKLQSLLEKKGASEDEIKKCSLRNSQNPDQELLVLLDKGLEQLPKPMQNAVHSTDIWYFTDGGFTNSSTKSSLSQQCPSTPEETSVDGSQPNAEPVALNVRRYTGRKRTACLTCRRSKARCDRAYPCSTCRERNKDCEYEGQDFRNGNKEEEVNKESILIKYSGGLNELSSAEEPGNYSQATPDIVFPTHLYPHAAQANPFTNPFTIPLVPLAYPSKYIPTLIRNETYSITLAEEFPRIEMERGESFPERHPGDW